MSFSRRLPVNVTRTSAANDPEPGEEGDLQIADPLYASANSPGMTTLARRARSPAARDDTGRHAATRRATATGGVLARCAGGGDV